jgi:FtsX-like permease family
VPGIGRLVAVLGRRAGLTFGVVTLLVSALLATVNITSRHALKLYVEDQLRRIPWDLAAYQRSAGGDQDEIQSLLRQVDGLERVESMAFLRARFPETGDVAIEVGGKPLTTPWLSLLAASDLSILPSELRNLRTPEPRNLGTSEPRNLGIPEPRNPGTSEPRNPGTSEPRNLGTPEPRNPGTPPRGAVIALVGPERAMGPAFLALQGARDFKVRVNVKQERRLLFETPVQGVIRLDRDELNRWLMDQTGSVSYIPYVGVILLMPFDSQILTRFDSVANGLLPPDMVNEEELEEGHIPLAEYHPEVVFLGRINRARLVSGWDVAGSLDRVAALNRRVRVVTEWAVNRPAGETSPPPETPQPRGADPSETDRQKEAEAGTGFIVDSTTHVLLTRMEAVARLVGIVALLVSLPLLWMGWVLAANLCGLLMLNERRTLGLLRLRGVPGRWMGRAFLFSVVAGGLAGGVAGLVAGSVGPLLLYERGRLPLDVLLDPQQLLFSAAFLVVSIVLALAVSRRLVRFATTISPLEASRRVSQSEAVETALRFGPLPAIALLLGLYTLVVSWVSGQALSRMMDSAAVRGADRLLDFLGLPLLLYGVATFLASKRHAIQSVLSVLIRPIAGALGPFAVRHLAVKPHRTAAFLLIVALMSSITLYPTITSRSFAEKAERGARVQLGADWQVLFNAPDLADVSELRGSLDGQLRALQPAVESLVARIKQTPGIADATYLYETVLPQFYLPGYGLKGVPMFMIGEPEHYLQRAYSEPVVGLSDRFEAVMQPLSAGRVAASPPVADFWKLEPGLPLLVGMDHNRGAVGATASGVLAYLPGIPPRSVTDRQGYVQARIDYLNHLFNSNAYLVSAAHNEELKNIELLIPRVIVLAWAAPGASIAETERQMIGALPSRPLEVHNLSAEIDKVGTDMFIALALANLRIYLIGGLLLAAIAILSIAMANYTEDKRTLALLRIRGVAPAQMWRFLLGTLLSPAALGFIVGGTTAIVAGFGLANYVWDLREIRTVVQLLPTHLRMSWTTAAVGVTLIVLLVGVASGFSWWVYQHTAHKRVREA